MMAVLHGLRSTLLIVLLVVKVRTVTSLVSTPPRPDETTPYTDKPPPLLPQLVSQASPVTEEATDKPPSLLPQLVSQASPVTEEATNKPPSLLPQLVSQASPVTEEATNKPPSLLSQIVSQASPVTEEAPNKPPSLLPQLVSQASPVTEEATNKPPSLLPQLVSQASPVTEEATNKPPSLLPQLVSQASPVTEKATNKPAAKKAVCEHILKEPRGTIVWDRQSKLCKKSTRWTVMAPPDHGLVLELHQVSLTTASNLTVTSFSTKSNDTKAEIEREIIGDEEFSYAPMLIRGDVTVELRVSNGPSTRTLFINISYVTYPLSTLPVRVTKKWLTYFVGSSFPYNCSGDRVVPEALRCDGVKHCFDNEDEKDCDYTQRGCGDWVPYDKYCFKLIITTIGGGLFDYDPKFCFREGTSLAVLPDNATKSLAGNMVRKSGVLSAWTALSKVQTNSKKIKHLYRFLWQWGSRGSAIAYEELEIQRHGVLLDCAVLAGSPKVHLKSKKCDTPKTGPRAILCMLFNDRINATSPLARSVHLQTRQRSEFRFPTKECSDGSLVQLFHQCRWSDFSGSQLSLQTGTSSQGGWSPNNFPLFHCKFGPPVHYNLVCDGLNDCSDGSDEQGCLPWFNKWSSCGGFMAYPGPFPCNGVEQCEDGSDEEDCKSCSLKQRYCTCAGCVHRPYTKWFQNCYDSHETDVPCELCRFDPSVVKLDGHGMSGFSDVGENITDMEGLFRCDNGMYIPSYLLQNGERDCLEGEDELIVAENFTCPGYYRCQDYGNCLHPDLVCDEIYHCPNKDDERYCNGLHFFSTMCTCEGFACSCRSHQTFVIKNMVYLKYLDISGSSRSVQDIITKRMPVLTFLNASSCHLLRASLTIVPGLRILDLSFNDLTGLSSLMFGKLARLTHLNLSGNPLIQTLDSAFTQFLTQTALTNLQGLVMTNTGLQGIKDNALSVLTQLLSLDISRNQIVKFDKVPLGGLVSLRELHVDDHRLCCLIVHDTECYAPVDELSSCSDLLRRDVSRVCLWAFSVLALVGNAGVIAYRVVNSKGTPWSTFHVLVVNLSAADLLMGVYMTMIGAADARFRGDYVTREIEWRHSNTCIAAGFLAFVSSEVSAFMICLITLDRFLRLCFPFKSQVHMGLRLCTVLCSVAWLCGVCLAALPLIAQLQFYGVTGICLPLPITRHSFSGQGYAFSVFIVMNFALFVLIGAGQAAIYRAIRATSKAAGSKRQNRDATIARRLFLVVLTDFCCWFPIGVMGLMAFWGIPIPGEVNVWAAIVVLPLNSALNPFLYTLNGLYQKWAENKVEKKTRKILNNLEDEIPKLPPRTVESLMLKLSSFQKPQRTEASSLSERSGTGPVPGTASTAIL